MGGSRKPRTPPRGKKIIEPRKLLSNEVHREFIVKTGNKHFYVELATEERPNMKFKFMLDTGAHRNFISAETVTALGVSTIDGNENVAVVGVANTAIRTLGSLQSKRVPTTFPI